MAEEPGISTSMGPFSGSMVAPGKMSLLSTIIAKIPSFVIIDIVLSNNQGLTPMTFLSLKKAR